MLTRSKTLARRLKVSIRKGVQVLSLETAA